MLVSSGLLAADNVQIVDRRPQTNLRSNCRSAGFKLIRQVRISSLFERHGLNHVAAALERVHLLQPALLAVNNAAAGGREHFVT